MGEDDDVQVLLDEVDEVDDVTFDYPFRRTSDLVRDAIRLKEAGNRDASFDKLLEAVFTAVQEGTEQVDELCERLDLLETSVSLLESR